MYSNNTMKFFAKFTSKTAYCLLLLTVIYPDNVVNADSPRRPEPYVLESADSKLRFVMLTDSAVKTKDGNTYTQSGLYHVDNAKEPIWLLEGDYSFSVYLSDDGDYLVMPGPWASRMGTMAVAFFHKGKLIKKYIVDDLISDKSAIVRTVSHFFWEKDSGFDSSTNRYFIITLARDIYLFDITTGEIIGEKHVSLPDIKASVLISGSEETEVSHLRQCKNIFNVFQEMKEHQLETGFTGFYKDEHKDKNSNIESIITIPFKNIKEINRIKDGDDSLAEFMLSLNDGQEINLVIGNNYSLCALNKNESRVEFEVNKLQKIIILDIDDQPYKESDNSIEFMEKVKQFKDRHSWSKISFLKVSPEKKQKARIIPKGKECTSDLAGYGSRSKAVCFDKIYENVRGPLMVVIPSGEGIERPFAIGKYEISTNDWDRYCFLSATCPRLQDRERANQPITGITFKQAGEYATWLSEQTGNRYRLPTYAEWKYAAAAAKGYHRTKTDFNCRTLENDEPRKAFSVKSGTSNGWGLKNYIGNVQEWVINTSGKTMAAGGHFDTDHADCNIDYLVPHDGNADDYTGFRILMEMN